jgi:hypothetical protein
MIVCRIFVVEPLEKYRLAKSIMTWEDNNEMYLREMGSKDKRWMQWS